MSVSALIFMILAIALLWGGLISSAVFLARKPEVRDYPPGGEDDEADQHADRPSMRDT